MKKWLLSGLGIGVLIVGGFFILHSYGYDEKQIIAVADYKDAEYVIDGRRVQLEDGVAETDAAPGSASKVITRYFGNEVVTDLDDDGREDIVFLLSQETGGSGIFYYVVAALNTERGYAGSEGIFLGDRIAPQTTELSQNPNHQNVIIVNYAERALGEPMTARPSIGKSIWLKLDPQMMQFGEVAQNFEGEADPSRMTLGMKTWDWIQTMYNNDTTVTPLAVKKFTLTFKDGQTFSATTDCNGVGGDYAVNGNAIIFTNMLSTLMYCIDSQEQDYTKMLNQVQSYQFTSKGELIFDLKMDSGSMIFR